jgi:Uma2 family endonuclease
MNQVSKLDDEMLEYEELDMPSLKHSRVQTNLTVLLGNEERFETFVELSLDIGEMDLSQFRLKAKDELIPDICIYAESPPILNEEVDDDLLRVSQIPDLAIEVLSLSQSLNFHVRKIKAFLALGVKSCWLVIPVIEVINVYSPNHKQTFDMNDTELVDKIMDIHLPIQKIFNWHKYQQA